MCFRIIVKQELGKVYPLHRGGTRWLKFRGPKLNDHNNIIKTSLIWSLNYHWIKQMIKFVKLYLFCENDPLSYRLVVIFSSFIVLLLHTFTYFSCYFLFKFMKIMYLQTNTWYNLNIRKTLPYNEKYNFIISNSKI